jgi:hypothetical protein
MQQFVVGILSSGVIGELAKTISDTVQNMLDRIEVVKQLQLDYGTETGVYANYVQSTINDQADAEQNQAYGSIFGGVADATSPIASLGYQYGRNNWSDKLKGLMSNQTEIGDAQNVLRGRDAEVVSGKTTPNKSLTENEAKEAEVSLNRLKDGDLDEARHEESIAKAVKNDKNMRSKLAIAKALRNAGSKEDIIRRGKLFDDLEKKLNDEKKSNRNAINEFHRETDNTVNNYLGPIGRAGSAFATGGFNNQAASNRRDQAEDQKIQEISKYGQDNEKSASDTNQKAFDNTAALYTEVIRAIMDVSRANSAA